MSTTTTLLCLLLAAGQPQAPGQPQDPGPRQEAGQGPTVRALIAEARGELEQGRLPDARAAIERALLRDPRNLEALSLSAAIADAAGDADRAVHDRFVWLELHDSRPRPHQDRKARKATLEALLANDAEAASFGRLQQRYVRGLVGLAKEYERNGDLLGAIDLWAHALEVDPSHVDAQKAILEIRRTGGAEVAVEDLFAGGGDPTDGMSAAELRDQDAAHATWEKAYTKSTDNYRYRTNAGKLVLETAAIAMEQMNRFYRRFFRFKEDGGKTPQIEIRIFKSRDEYLALGTSPAEWSGGQFTGSAVETFVGGVTGTEGLRDMYRTLFHEAGHQFVSLTGAFVPGWLNEAYASFFEGCTMLSNGTVRWNQPPPGRLFPLATRMERGWMADVGEAADQQRAPPFRMIVGGAYDWGPPWYAPTWGVVYFLYNYRDDAGRAVYRDALHAYYASFKRGRPIDAIPHFEATVLAAPLSPVKRIDELDPLWREWILALRDRETGKSDGGNRLLAWAAAAIERGEKTLALEFLLEARDDLGADPDLLWRTAELLQDLRLGPRAAAAYREFKRELELLGRHEDPRHAESEKRIRRLDPIINRYRTLQQKVGTEGLALARGYEERGLPTMALEIARRMSARYSMPDALEYYAALAERTGKTLARWRLAYDEQSLDGWSGDGDNTYQAYGAMIRAQVAAGGEGMATQLLTCDVTFDGDFSLEADIRFPLGEDGKPLGRLAGLCFGRKSDQDHHAVLLHPDGFLDISTNRGGVWEVRDHRQIPLAAGQWHRLRIDVTGSSLDTYLDGFYVRSLDYPNERVVRGGFGLITGRGRADYREVRLIARDPHDPAARIERRLAMQKVLADASLRREGSFAGIAPPALDVRWHRGAATTLKDLHGGLVMIVLWSPAAEAVIPTARYVEHLIGKARAAGTGTGTGTGTDSPIAGGLQTIVICDAGTTTKALEAALEKTPMTGARIAIDAGTTFDRYFVKAGHFGMPRFLLIGRTGRVVFEGDPGFASGVGWRAADGPTYVDKAFTELLESR